MLLNDDRVNIILLSNADRANIILLWITYRYKNLTLYYYSEQ